MNTVGREVIGRCDYDMLIADNRHPLDVCHVLLAAGAAHKKGEILEYSEDGKCYILGTMAAGTASQGEENTEGAGEAAGKTEETDITVETKEAVAAYILAEDTDATEADAVAAAYRSGSFIRNALIVMEGYSLSDKDETALRNGGIYLRDAFA